MTRPLMLSDALLATAGTFETWRVVICTGEDDCAVQDGARQLSSRALDGQSTGSFRFLDTEAAQREVILGHAATAPLGGGDPVVRVRSAGDRHVKLLADLLAIKTRFRAVLEAPGLTARSALLKAAQASAAQIVRCHPDGKAKLQAALHGRGQRLAADALPWAVDRASSPGWGLWADTLALSGELGATLGLDCVQACGGDADGLAAEAEGVWDLAYQGSPATLSMLADTLGAGGTAVGLIRAGMTATHRRRAALSPGITVWPARAVGIAAAPRLTMQDLVAIGGRLLRCEAAAKSGRHDPVATAIAAVRLVLDHPGLSRASAGRSARRVDPAS